uniref:Mitochondrial import inner membrane translocase subunit n=1 Tax=Hemiselmis andersenii TaxID=464988 RepID=A0A6T8GYQ5_HEMAN|mmetsp:Transcript_33268/g.77849  ORF Transcript_33268/g.77849 Transcript_33268/m.77849 type:complete len:105 (+) Transcript_33268:101-415(+)|eukprot:CAMPEP_0169451786 /NCGR_PEP_ID=MMETSP1042-20121227/13883_1 /TAXON_ID=464988 /ORGANISM="Hemiselmis andersenii, Strain CCMP1180" /LENGTH=104 /DNA_ID=CAMNT_0009563721 /DNA_START=94 /DNA_END=408 /DNA_ORIENTATION=+
MGWWPDILNPFKIGVMSKQEMERKRAIIQLVGETEAMGDMMVRMNRQCYEKCSAALMERGEDLSLDETACIDCCAAKFLEAQMKVGQVFMQEAQESGMPGAPSA